MAERWRDNRGEAAASVPPLPAEVWAHVHQQTTDEATQLAAWVAWADATLMQLVVIWFRTSGQRNTKWLGNLTGKNGGISTASTDNIAIRFRPWCRVILHPDEENEPMHYIEGTNGAPASFINVYMHMLSMMNYFGLNNVIERLQRTLRVLARCLQPKSGVPKYIPRPPDSDDEEDGWDAEAPTPGQQPQRHQGHTWAIAYYMLLLVSEREGIPIPFF